MANRSTIYYQQKTVRVRAVLIRAKITIPYLLLSLILAVAAAYLITQLVVENVEERFTKQLFEAGKISSELIVNDEMQQLETLRLLVNVEGISSAILDDDFERIKNAYTWHYSQRSTRVVEFLDQMAITYCPCITVLVG